ncbi:MAG TPA: lysylphosphatidylglycerol synthase transmembrane domain-containing protein, partial [Sandaracinaceae bacterium]
MSEKRTRARRWLAVLKVVVSAGLLAWLLVRMAQREGIPTLVDRLYAIEPAWLAAAVALHALAVLGGVLRWRSLLSGAGIELPLGWLVRSFLVGRFVGAFTPSTAGLDGWRIWDAGTASGAMGKSAAVIVVEKLVGLIGMALVCAALVPFGGAELLGPSAILVALALAGGAATGLAAIARPALLRRLGERLPRALRGRSQRALEALSSARLDARRLATTVLLGVLSHVALSAVFWATAGALAVDVDAAT